MKPVGHVCVLRRQSLQRSRCFPAPARASEGVSQRRLRERVARSLSSGGFKRDDRLVVSPLLYEGLTQAEIQLVPSRLELHCLVELLDGLIETPPVIQGPSHLLNRHDGKGVEELRVTVRRHRLVAATGISQTNTPLPVHIGVAGSQGDGTIRLPLRCAPIPIVEQAEQAERRMSFGKFVVESHRAGRRGLRLRERLLRLHAEEIGQLDETLGDAGVGRRELWISPYGVLKISDRPVLSVFREYPPVIAAFEIERIGLPLDGARTREPGFLVLTQFGTNTGGDVARGSGRAPQNVGYGSLVGLGPQVLICGSVNQLGCDSKPVTRFHHGSLQQRLYAQGARDLRDGFFRIP